MHVRISQCLLQPKRQTGPAGSAPEVAPDSRQARCLAAGVAVAPSRESTLVAKPSIAVLCFRLMSSPELTCAIPDGPQLHCNRPQGNRTAGASGRPSAGRLGQARKQNGAARPRNYYSGVRLFPRSLQEAAMNGIIYLIGLIVVILAILSFFGLR